jgi:hypothetical protein
MASNLASVDHHRVRAIVKCSCSDLILITNGYNMLLMTFQGNNAITVEDQLDAYYKFMVNHEKFIMKLFMKAFIGG